MKLGMGAVIGLNVSLGRDVVVGANASIDGGGAPIFIGHRTIIGPGARIGQAGFGFDYDETGQRRGWIPKAHDFGIIIGDDVQIGANTCIDRGSWRDTVILDGAKIDNLVHIAHNVRVGPRCVVIAGAELSGSVELDEEAYIAPHACVRERLHIGRRAIVGLGAVVVKDVPALTVVVGNPARELGPVTDYPPPPPR